MSHGVLISASGTTRQGEADHPGRTGRQGRSARPASGLQPGSQPGRHRGRSAALVLALLLAPACRCTCTAPGGVPEDADLDAAQEARADRAEWPPFPDATPPDVYHPGPFPDAEPCDATFLRLPPNGLSFISVVSNQGPWVAYDYDETPDNFYDRRDIYLYNLDTCTEQRVTYAPTLWDRQPRLWQDRIVFSHQVAQDLREIAIYNLSTSTFSSSGVTSPYVMSILGAAGPWVAYADTTQSGLNAVFDWRLVNLDTGDSTLLESGEDGAGSGGDMSETFFTWPSLKRNENRGIWAVELATSRIVEFPGSDKGGYPTTGGEWFVWEDWKEGHADIWGVRWSALYDPVHVTDNGAVNGFPRLRGHLLCFRTTLWSGNSDWDIAVMDMDTWVVRRVTPSPWPTLRCEHADGDWVVFRQDTIQWGYSRVYAFNLRRNGLLGPDGHLVPE